MIILGIDPGTQITGYSVIILSNKNISVLACDVIKLGNSRIPLAERVCLFFESVERIIINYKVTMIALETAFLGKNPSNFLKLGYLRGALYILIHKYSLQMKELSPSQIKQAITGSGSSDKDQVARVLKALFPQLPIQGTRDSTDALATALAAAWQIRA